jgi:hypothetical protein
VSEEVHDARYAEPPEASIARGDRMRS